VTVDPLTLLVSPTGAPGAAKQAAAPTVMMTSFDTALTPAAFTARTRT
jgi:hypothetical protein